VGRSSTTRASRTCHAPAGAAKMKSISFRGSSDEKVKAASAGLSASSARAWKSSSVREPGSSLKSPRRTHGWDRVSSTAARVEAWAKRNPSSSTQSKWTFTATTVSPPGSAIAAAVASP